MTPFSLLRGMADGLREPLAAFSSRSMVAGTGVEGKSSGSRGRQLLLFTWEGWPCVKHQALGAENPLQNGPSASW